MPTYSWACPEGHHWEIVTTVSTRDDGQQCPVCLTQGQRQLTLPNLDRTAASGWNNQGFHPALGRYVRNDQEAKKIAKSRGMEEVGNESPDKMHAHFDKQREETAQKRYDDIDRVKQFGD